MDTTQRCRTCKHWGENRVCNEAFVRVVIKDFNTSQERIELDADDELSQSLITGPDFGCVHWEGKE